MTTSAVRTSRLGGEIRRRSLLGGRRSKVGNTALGIALGVGMLLMLLVGGVWGIGLAAALFGSTYLATSQNQNSGRSPAYSVALAWRWRSRTRQGETTVIPLHLAEPIPAPRNKAEKKAALLWARQVRDEAPGLEGAKWLDVERGQPAVLLHTPPGETAYLSVAIEVDGQSPGMRGPAEYERASEAFGRLLARLARQDGFIRGVQSITRIVPLDSAAHERWAEEHVDLSAPAELLASYAQLVQMTARVSEMMRHYLVLRFPLTLDFTREAAELGEGEEGWVRLAAAQTSWVGGLAIAADLRNPRPLSQRRLAALLRHMQNPSWPVDQTNNVNRNTWLRPQRVERDAVIVDEAWWHATASIPRTAVTSEPVHVHWIRPLLHGITTPVIRTISISVALQPAAAARRQAKEDVTIDMGARLETAKRGVIDDGSDALQLSASQQRLADLAPGSGIHGAQWTGFVSVSAQSPEALGRAITTVTDAAGECGIAWLDWCDRQHDAAFPATWPVWRGMEVPQ